jgi:hypothetical protein
MYTAEELESKPTLCVGQESDLKVDTGRKRVWLSRCGVEDGEPFDRKVTVERWDGRRWVISAEYPG